MDNNFEKVYKEIKEEFNNDYLPPKNSTKPKLIMYIFLGWIIINTIQIIVARILSKDSNIYSILKWLSIFLILAFVIIVASGMNNNVEYWKKAFSFKDKVGRAFWKKVNSDIKYNPNREEIPNDIIKNELENIYPNSKIIDIEDMLLFNDISMYTTRFDNSEEKRITGTFIIIDNCEKNISNIKEFVKELNLDITNLILEIKQIENKVYIFLDAKEVFLFNNLNFFNEQELHDDYLRFCDIVTIKNNLVS